MKYEILYNSSSLSYSFKMAFKFAFANFYGFEIERKPVAVNVNLNEL